MTAFLAGLRKSRRKVQYTITVGILTALGRGVITTDQARLLGWWFRLRGFSNERGVDLQLQ
jgi:hypothetical protein